MTQPPTTTSRPGPAWADLTGKPWLPPLAIVLLAALPAIGLLRHEFVFDSLLIIQDNARVHTLESPWELFAQQYWPPPYIGGLYRPASILLFALEWAAGGGSPVIFHLVSILLYVALCLAVYRLARLILPHPAAWAAAALFAVHPVHTESVAAAVHQSEIVVALILTFATATYIDARRQHSLTPLKGAGLLALYVVGCLFKEHALVLPGLFLAAELTLVQNETWSERVRRLGLLYAAAAGIGLGLIVVRARVLQGDVVGSFAADALVGQSLGGRLLTMLAVVPEWARLLFWPSHLQVRYSPQEIVAATGWGASQIAGVLLLLLSAWGVLRFRRSQPAASFAILWIGVALFPVHNVLVPTGIVLAERTLLLASVGAVILVAVGLAWLADRGAAVGRYQRAPAVVLAALVVLGAVRTAARYPVWHDQFTLFQQTTIDAPLSYEAHFGYADLLAGRGRVQEAETEYLIAIELFPEMEDGTMLARRTARVYQNLGNLYRASGLCRPAIQAYDDALAQSASVEYNDIRRSLIACLLYEAEYARAASEARIGVEGGWDEENFRRLLATADSALAVNAPPKTVRVRLE